MITRRFIASLVFALVATVTAAAQQDETPRFEVGGHFSSTSFDEPTVNLFIRPATCPTVKSKPGFGGRFTYNITRAVAAEAEADFYPNGDNECSDDYTVGRAAQGLFGVKAGKRFKSFGLYGKVRPGFVRFGQAFAGTRREGGDLINQTGRTNFAVDLGGVVEFYPSRRVVTRFDFGDTIIRYKELRYELPPLCPVNPSLPCLTTGERPGATTHNFQFTAGVGFRF